MLFLEADILRDLMKDGQEHPYLSPIWILKYALIREAEHTEMRVLLVRNQDIEPLVSASFVLVSPEGEFRTRVTEFRKQQDNPDYPVFFCAFETPEDLTEPYSLELTQLTFAERSLNISQMLKGPLNFNPAFEENIFNRFLQKHYKNYAQAPVFTEDYWQCICLKYNGNEEDTCPNCGRTKAHMQEIARTGIEDVALRVYLQVYEVKLLKGSSAKIEWQRYKEQLVETLHLSEETIKAKEVEKHFMAQYKNLAWNSSSNNYVKGFQGAMLLLFFLASVMVLYNAYASTHDFRTAMSRGDYEAALIAYDRSSPILISDDELDQARYGRANRLEATRPEAALDIYLELGEYRDAPYRAQEMYYRIGMKYVAVSEDAKAVEYFLQAPDVIETLKALREANLRLGFGYYNQGLIFEAYPYLVGAKEDPEARALIKTILETEFPLKAKVFINASETGVNHETSLNVKDPIYVHLILEGGIPGAKFDPQVYIVTPNGQTTPESFADIVTGDPQWVGWPDGLYKDHSIGETGMLTVRVVEPMTQLELATSSIEIVR